MHETMSIEEMGKFLAAISTGASLSTAAREAGISRRTALRLRESNAQFAIAWEDAEAEFTDMLEEAAHRRALAKSDVLLHALLAFRRPEKYGRQARRAENYPTTTPEPAQPTDPVVDEMKKRVAKFKSIKGGKG